MSNRNIDVDELSDTIESELMLYSERIVSGIKKQANSHIKRLVQDTKATAPVGKRKKHYKDHITSKKVVDTPSKILYKWYVRKPEYRLSHLLEHGHATKNGGRVEGTQFIKKASEPILEQYIKAVEEVIKNG